MEDSPMGQTINITNGFPGPFDKKQRHHPMNRYTRALGLRGFKWLASLARTTPRKIGGALPGYANLLLVGPGFILAWYALLLVKLLFLDPGSVLYRLSLSFAAWRSLPRMLNYTVGLSRSPNLGAMPISSRVLVVVEPSSEAMAIAYVNRPLLKPAPVLYCQTHIITMLQANRVPYDLSYGVSDLIRLLPPYDPPISTLVYDILIFENARLFNETMSRLTPTQLITLGDYVMTHGTGFVVIPTFYPDYATTLATASQPAPFYPFKAVGAERLIDMRAYDVISAGEPVLKITRSDNLMTKGPFQTNATVIGLAADHSHQFPSNWSGFAWSDQALVLAATTISPARECGPERAKDHAGLVCERGQLKAPVAVMKRLHIPKPLATNNETNALVFAFLGGSPGLWPFRLLLLDTVLHFLFRANQLRSPPKAPLGVVGAFSGRPSGPLSVPFNSRIEEFRLNLLDRLVLVDIDDGFVGQTDPTVVEIKAMIDFQDEIRSTVPNFTFNIGYSGLFYPQYNKFGGYGYRYLVDNRDKFWWFPHSYDHKPSYDQLTQVALNQEIDLNLKFGQDKGLITSRHYAVSPLHSGIFPVQENLYATWRSHDIRVTSTYLYPHLYPWSARRGFIHRNISVLPRQTCGVYTHTRKLESYPRGRANFDSMIFGGSIFDSFINNRVNIFMTHIPNYVDDQLAIYAMRHSIQFVTQHTNLKLRSVTPVDLASKFFEIYPQDKQVFWQNPCINKHHFALWQRKYDCYRIPKILIVGPQKTGTTALLSFLLLHPLIRTNIPTPAFEEVQFFSNDRIYENGIDWYIDLFKLDASFPYMSYNASWISFVDKSATYFDSTYSPERAYALVPYATIVTILLDPIDRAHSWYQHVKSHGDQVANSYTFHDIITTNGTGLKSQDLEAILKLRQRILSPGFYAHHLKRWSVYFPANQIYVVDGNEFKADPRPIMNELQTFLGLKLNIEYDRVLRYDENKKFYCPLLDPRTSEGQTKCLGKGKGRVYDAMENRTWLYLLQYFMPYDRLLYDWLVLNNKKVPLWLQSRIIDDLSKSMPS